MILKYFQIPETFESRTTVNDWKRAIREREAIQWQEVERTVADVAYRLWLPIFCARFMSSLCLLKEPLIQPGEPNQLRRLEGLDKWAAYVGRRTLQECKTIFGDEHPKGLALSHLERGILVFARSEFADPAQLSGRGFPAAWITCDRFWERWLAVKAGARKTSRPRASQRYILSLGWDGEIIPVRYFANVAAAEWIRSMIQKAGGEGEDLHFLDDAYEKGIRGPQGLMLSQDAHFPPIVVEWDAVHVRIDQNAAEQHGFFLYPREGYEKIWAPRRVDLR